MTVVSSYFFSFASSSWFFLCKSSFKMLCTRTRTHTGPAQHYETRKKKLFYKKGNAKMRKLRGALWHVRWLDDACDGLNIIFDLFFISCIHTHIFFALPSLLPYGFSHSFWWVLRISRACFILKYNFDRNFVHFFFSTAYFILRLVVFFSCYFSTLTLENLQWLTAWSLSFRMNYTHIYEYIRDHHHHACVFFMLFLPYGHAEPLITFLLRTHFFLLILPLNITTKRIND